MRASTQRNVIILVIVMVVVLYFSFRPSPALNEDEKWLDSITPGAWAEHGKETPSSPESSDELAGTLPIPVSVPTEAESPPPPHLDNPPPERPPPLVAARPQTTQRDGDLAPLPEYVTGHWTPEMHATQAALVMQLSGHGEEQAEWTARYRRAKGPPDHPVDPVIRKQLRDLKRCDGVGELKWTREDLLRDLKYFVSSVYPRRPIKFNQLGMRLSHSFGCWFITKQLQPKYIIESGVHMGQSTWLLRQAAPNAKIISLDPRVDMKHWDRDATYYVGTGTTSKPGFDVHPWRDFSEVDWSFIEDKASALVLIDDHQNGYKRILQAAKIGFKRMLFDDNWSPLQGDNYSAKQMCDESGGLALRPPEFPSQKVLMCDNFHMKDRFISLEEHRENRRQLLELTSLYYESPPVLFVPPHMEFTQFGHKPRVDHSSVEYVLPRPSNRLLRWMTEAIIPPPIVQSEAEFKDAGLGGLEHKEFYNYANLGYIEMH